MDFDTSRYSHVVTDLSGLTHEDNHSHLGCFSGYESIEFVVKSKIDIKDRKYKPIVVIVF